MHIDFHWHKEVEIVYVLHGSITVYLDQRQYTLHEDDLIVMNSMSVHKLERKSQDNVLLTLQFGPELLSNSTSINCNSVVHNGQNASQIYSIKQHLAQMVLEINKKAQGYKNYTMGKLQILCGSLIRHFSEGSNAATSGSGSKEYDYKRLNRVLTYIDQNYNEKITLQHMAQLEHLSVHYFSHFFTDKIGIPFQKYLTLIRLEKADVQLVESEKSVSDIALDCGFANVKLFNKYFKEKYGCTPGAYRKASLVSETDHIYRKPLTYEESSSGDYYEMDTLNAMQSLYRYLEPKTDRDDVKQHYSSAQPVASRQNIKISMIQKSVAYEKQWNITMTAGRAVEGLREDWRKQLKELTGHIPFRYIRFHGIFNDEMMVYSEDGQGNPIYNWSYVDKLYDFLLEQGVRPFVELSFMPSLLARSEETIFWWRGNISPPSNLAKWEALVCEFIRHCLNRYGLDEVKSWYFEVWNEPDLAGVCWAGSKEEYFAFYEATVRVIKAVSPVLKAGGPAMGYGSLWNDTWAEEFLDYCSKNDVPLDFFSFHIYSEYPRLKVDEESLTKIMPPSFYKESIDRLHRKLHALQYGDVEIHITEWNFSLYDRNLLHDTMFMAPFVIYHAMNTLSEVKALAYWAFTDVFEESIVPNSPFYGGFGLINRDGLKKPSYYAFELLQKLGEELLVKDDGYVMTRKNDGSLQLLLYHYVHVDHLFSSGDWSGFSSSTRYDVFEEKGSKRFDVMLNELSGVYKCTSYQLDREHGSVFDEWLHMGAPQSLTGEEIAYLDSRSGPQIRTELVKGDSWSKEITLPPHGVLLITLDKQF